MVERIHAPATIHPADLLIEDADDADLSAFTIMAINVMSDIRILDEEVVAAIFLRTVPGAVKQRRSLEVTATDDDLLREHGDLARILPISEIIARVNLIGQLELSDQRPTSNHLAAAAFDQDPLRARIGYDLDAVAFGDRRVSDKR